MARTKTKRRARKAFRQRAGWSLRAWLDEKLSDFPALLTKRAATKLRQFKTRTCPAE
jgi:hypothetical protein